MLYGALRVSVAERYDVIIDFAQFPAGSKVYLKETARSLSAIPSPPIRCRRGSPFENVLMRFNVVNRECWFPPDTPAIPATLCTYPTAAGDATDV